jgi:hypothetical protein
LPDPIEESEVNLVLGDWIADTRTTAALERQAALMGFARPVDYLRQLIAATLASNEADTILATDGRILNGSDGYGPDGMPQNV